MHFEVYSSMVMAVAVVGNFVVAVVEGAGMRVGVAAVLGGIEEVREDPRATQYQC